MRDESEVHVFVATWCRQSGRTHRLAFSQAAKARSWVEWKADQDIEWEHQETPSSWIGHINESRRAVVYKVPVEDPTSWVTRYPILAEL